MHVLGVSKNQWYVICIYIHDINTETSSQVEVHTFICLKSNIVSFLSNGIELLLLLLSVFSQKLMILFV